jgi:Pyruvate/2-oxoacid:ferredoxin oxidoreductase delta subunit
VKNESYQILSILVSLIYPILQVSLKNLAQNVCMKTCPAKKVLIKSYINVKDVSYNICKAIFVFLEG